MKVLAFERAGEMVAGRRVRRQRFQPRSSLPVSAACLVANAIRETLGTLVAAPLSVRLLEPLLPAPQAWQAILQDALLFGLRGPVLDAAIVLRVRDACALAALAFGETDASERDLSAIERTIVTRAAAAIAPALAAVCGFRETPPVEALTGLSGFATYFEVLVERPASLRIGIALSHDPPSGTAGALRLEDLLEVPVEARVEFARGSIEAGALLDLGIGTIVPMMTRVHESGLLLVDETAVAAGDCGANGQRAAMIVKSAANGVGL